MKINGRKLGSLNIEILVIPRPDLEDGSSGDIVFKAQAVNDFSEFETLFPRPEPPKILRRGETVATPDFNDKLYKERVMEFIKNRTSYTILKSLAPTPDLTWETVDMAKPETWSNYATELKEAGFNDTEIAKIVDLVTAANGMDEEKYKQARLRFLATQGAPASS